MNDVTTMAFAFNIRCDNGSADPIRALWETCAALEETPSLKSLGYPPHITLAIYDDVDTAQLYDAFERVFDNLNSVTIRFGGVDFFETPNSLVLWAAPILPRKVLSVHKQIHATIDINLCRPTYRPGAWVPHCSLALSIDPSRREEVVSIVNRPIEPFDVVFDAADCASFLPVEVRREKLLRPTSDCDGLAGPTVQL